MKILCIGDVVGSPGRRAVRELLPGLVDSHGIDLVVANCENAAGGIGLTTETARDLLSTPIGVLTAGNHIWRYKEVFPLLDSDPRILRPYNYPDGAPGRGFCVAETAAGVAVGVLNLEGRVFMDPLPCPFAAADRALEELSSRTPIIVVDVHAEATSEKRALGWYLDGRASVVYGTHTHVATADEEVLPGGTAYITDIGMTGPHDSVIGMKKEPILERFLSMRPASFSVAKRDVRLCGALFDVDEESGRAHSVERLRIPLE